MTREEAITVLQIIKPTPSRADGKITTRTLGMIALEMAIKALEQEPILDKIKAEIEKEIIPRNSDQYDHEAMWQNCGLRMALKVIDKYWAEKESEE